MPQDGTNMVAAMEETCGCGRVNRNLLCPVSLHFFHMMWLHNNYPSTTVWGAGAVRWRPAEVRSPKDDACLALQRIIYQPTYNFAVIISG